MTTDLPADASYDRRHGGGTGLDELEIRSFLEREYPRLVNAVALACGSSRSHDTYAVPADVQPELRYASPDHSKPDCGLGVNSGRP